MFDDEFDLSQSIDRVVRVIPRAGVQGEPEMDYTAGAETHEHYRLTGSPNLGLTMGTWGFFVGFAAGCTLRAGRQILPGPDESRGSWIIFDTDPTRIAAMARSVSLASRTFTGVNSTPNDEAADWIAPNKPVP